MFHPFEGNLNNLKDNEVEERLQEITRKYFLAARMGKLELLTQLEVFVNIYKQELAKRLRAKTQTNYDGDLDQLINVD